MTIKVGTRLASAVCDTQVIVVRAADPDVAITCGGTPMHPLGEPAEPTGAPVDRERPTLLGKRYVDSTLGLELLCTRAGAATLSANGVPMDVKQAASLPASD